MTYLDTSALVKRFVAEKGSVILRRLMARGHRMATATIAYAETYSGLTRRHREGALTASQYQAACEHFERDWTEFVRVELRDDVLARARDVIRRHVLRGFDGIHLASALILQEGAGEAVTVVAADDRLLRAAASEGLAILDLETGRTTVPARG